MNGTGYLHRPSSVGILACELYIPALYVEQSKLETHENVSKGKNTIGLGQQRMSICSDHEDICSLCLTVLSRLLDETGVHPQQIGRLDVGTETLIDKAKSIKTVLMQLFVDHDNTAVEGVDNVNACYGGTAAIFNAIHWIESSFWDGRYAVVVMGDIAIYPKGNARPTGGAGACALLIGPNAPVVFESGCRATHMAHVYDFYKPNFTSLYPVVDGQLSIQSVISALDTCYTQFCTKSQMNHESHSHTHTTTLTSREVNLSTFAAVLFHTPYCKLAQKSLARLYLNDLIRACPYIPNNISEKYKNFDLRTTINDKELEREMVEQSRELYEQKTLPGLYFAQNMGNMYTPSVYYSLFAFLISQPTEEQLYGRRILLFSYGSGLASSMYSVVCRKVHECRFTLAQLQRSILRAKLRLDHERMEVTPDIMDKILQEREQTQHKVPFTPKQPNEMLKSGDMYLKSIDDSYRRYYDKFVANDNSERDNDNERNVQELYTKYFQNCQTSDDA
ncbi:unnamed protein product [Adineta steineri]|uniref:Hydroxymethylglutaryl-CoA synthase n=1 Tax=Adineta steineri TaxID=433720 RepID=A0A818IFJ6_9BILA|nr:unnamed protein product [Adineta steineri]CAF1295198.1 unnamed protein product [Adineta steineri]CAF3522640.1 unnamed protein product [Adineta steineri]CAF3695027.1 unnamed protein product [Adineta steineri]CAF3897049.1 unnamed protein product [Adineta steineri]